MFGQILREARVGSRLSIRQASELSGVTESQWVSWEDGDELPTILDTPKLLNAISSKPERRRFERFITGKLSAHKCVLCGNDFVKYKADSKEENATHDVNQRHCSFKCQREAYRERQRKAKRLYKSGESFKAIAKSLGITTDKAKRWATSESVR